MASVICALPSTSVTTATGELVRVSVANVTTIVIYSDGILIKRVNSLISLKQEHCSNAAPKVFHAEGGVRSQHSQRFMGVVPGQSVRPDTAAGGK